MDAPRSPQSLIKDSPAGGRGPIRVMVVDDSLIVRTVLSRVIDPEPDMEIVAKASSAELAIAELGRTEIDLVLLDLEMPGMGGLKALPKIVALNERLPVLVVSSLTAEGAEHTLAALAMGAADTMLKPRSGQFDEAYRRGLVDRIRALAAAHRRPHEAAAQAAFTPAAPKVCPTPEVIAIGASTGGIHAMAQLLRHLPQSVRQPILVVQHLPAAFAEVFARQLHLASGRPASVAAEGTVIEPGHIYVAAGDAHMVVGKRSGRLHLDSNQDPAPSGCTPSVDPLFASLADHCGARTLAIVLSGMGRDGAIGAVALAESGGRILVQDQASSAVWGMPRAVAEAGLAEAVLPPDRLGQRVTLMCGGSR